MTHTNLNRFLEAQNKLYLTAKAEIEKGKKETHWMWFIFPQLKGLGKSSLSHHYGIDNLNEANEFMNHPILSKNLIEISKSLLVYKNKSAEGILGDLDACKLLSSMTLFSRTEQADPVFQEILDIFFFGCIDKKTLYLMEQQLELVA